MRGAERERRARARRRRQADLAWTAGRRLVVVDLENVVGGLCRTEAMTRWGRRFLLDALDLRPHDQVVVGVDGETMHAVAWDWPGARIVLGRHMRNGADLALLDVLDEGLVRRFNEVALVSGDAIFTDAVASLTSQGIKVTVVAHENSLSLQLRLVASEVVLLSREPAVPAQRSA